MWLQASIRLTCAPGSDTEPAKLTVDVLDQAGTVVDSSGALPLPLANPVTYSGVGIDCTPQTSWDGLPTAPGAAATKPPAAPAKPGAPAPNSPQTMHAKR